MRKQTLQDYSLPDGSLYEAGATRYVRTANFMVAMTWVNGHTRLERDNVDEYMVVAPAGIMVAATAGTQTLFGDGDDLFIAPPGHSVIEAEGSGWLARIFSHRATDLVELAVNQADYADGAAEIAPLIDWPSPIDGFRLRHYPLQHYVNGSLPGRCFRSSNLMVNITDVYPGKRDSRKLKPHSHSDYEQITLTGAGQFVHHLRAPWGIDSTQWQADQHLEVGSPSLLTIPAGQIHTTQAMEAGCWLVDVFAPPRMDFSKMAGFVRNADEYPMPPTTC
ncbi:hypothetical protein F3J45_02285 [Pantoea sp. Ap-967]|uniref:hypothetical protein n=1 Tax=Pantoea sp. Ap-967 TaxID=2608362 RepID=UPI001421B4EC|nr:hypothetical protein [Pantoea sp. Ap-967]NIE73294.1 hypothetical protein [Pantoea sp. Ap-967]